MERGEFFLVNAFTGPDAKGNQCAVICVGEEINDSDLLKSRADDFNLPATAFIQPVGDKEFNIRWFAPDSEIGLCGHGTIAATYALCSNFSDWNSIKFNYRAGVIYGKRESHGVSITGDGFSTHEEAIPERIQRAVEGRAVGYFPSPNKHLILLKTESDVIECNVDLDALNTRGHTGFAITAQGSSEDIVSRVFYPGVKFPEDPVTGSAHMVLAPFWAERLGKNTLTARQVSERGGIMTCDCDGDQVKLTADCEIFGRGKLNH